ncbi:MAG: peptidase [Romboutsia sp.]|nr:peptidase [Romboutsia sp.]
MKKIVFFIIISVSILFLNDNKLDNIKGLFKNDINDIYTNKVILNEGEINNFQYIKIGDSEESVISKIGEPSRKDSSEYSFTWYVYNQYKGKFAMVGIENKCVVALFSNSINSNEAEGIILGDNKSNVISKYIPIEYKKKGNIKYMINSNGEYDIIKENYKYITYFYDVIDGNKVCSYQIISQDVEDKTNDIYAKESNKLKKSFELQSIDLINSTRYKYDLNYLNYSKKATISSRKHSSDMISNNYFDHINKNEESPFDRMKKEDIIYISAGENIASGQFSAIYAHEALMNSKGHRKNILGDYKYIGIGVDFGGQYKIYYTQNFYK